MSCILSGYIRVDSTALVISLQLHDGNAKCIVVLEGAPVKQDLAEIVAAELSELC